MDVNLEYDLLIPAVLEEDINQEAELLRLSGKTPSKKLLRLKASVFREVLFADQLPGSATPLFEGVLIPPQGVIEQIVEWAVIQSEEVQSMIYRFLEEPSEEGLAEILSELRLQGVLLPPMDSKPPGKPMPFSQLLLYLLDKNGPMTLDQIYTLAREHMLSRRPEAAVRQLLRRYISEGKVEKVNDDLYRTTDT